MASAHLTCLSFIEFLRRANQIYSPSNINLLAAARTEELFTISAIPVGTIHQPTQPRIGKFYGRGSTPKWLFWVALPGGRWRIDWPRTNRGV